VQQRRGVEVAAACQFRRPVHRPGDRIGRCQQSLRNDDGLYALNSAYLSIGGAPPAQEADLQQLRLLHRVGVRALRRAHRPVRSPTTTAYQDEGLTLQPCSTPGATVWIIDTADSRATAPTYFPIVNGSTTDFYPSVRDDLPRQG
jgi:hypothetical protein